MQKIPLTILNGFLGAGKTTLLRSLLIQAHKQQLAVCVIVNDMSELDVDGVLIANTEIVNTSKHNFITLSADSISSRSGIAKLDAALTPMLANHRPDIILLETSGSSHPLPLVRYFRDHPQLQLHGFLSLVDSVMLHDDYQQGEALIPRLQSNLTRGERRIENLLAEQMMFCSHLLLTKNDRLPASSITRIAQAIHPLNPYVAVMAVPWGNLSLGEMLAMPPYDFQRVAGLIVERAAEVDALEPGAWQMASEVIHDDRPFHPQRLWDTCHHFMGAGIYRSKGFFWLPTRDDLALLWNQATGSISLEFISYWKAGILEHSDSPLTVEERASVQQAVANMPGRFGDRRCSLTVIGEPGEVKAFTAALKRCFLNQDEIAWWQSGGEFADPWPQRVARVTA